MSRPSSSVNRTQIQKACFVLPLLPQQKSSWPRTGMIQSFRHGRELQFKTSNNRHHPVPVFCGLGLPGFMPSSYSNSRDRLPGPDADCACGSEKPYGKCCRRFHTAQSSPPLAEDLLRARYSAYAYMLPSYIMKTTHRSLSELDRRKWKREILEFCRDYQFLGGVDIVDQQSTGPYTTRILFRANLMERNANLSFLEMATFVRERNIWYYKSGKLVDIDDRGV